MTFKQRAISLLTIMLGLAGLTACGRIDNAPPPPPPPLCSGTENILDVSVRLIDGASQQSVTGLPFEVGVLSTSPAEHPGVALGENADGAGDLLIASGVDAAGVELNRTTEWHPTICFVASLPVTIQITATFPGDPDAAARGSEFECFLYREGQVVVALDHEPVHPGATPVQCSYVYTP